jgi:hypothetical protein
MGAGWARNFVAAEFDRLNPPIFTAGSSDNSPVEITPSNVIVFPVMTTDGSSADDNKPRVLLFKRQGQQPRAPVQNPPPVEDLTKYERGDEADDYRHRMIMNVLVFVFVVGLIAAGLWLADTMARMRKNQDCVLQGRRGCTPVEVSKDRW